MHAGNEAPAADAAQALRELQGILAKANKTPLFLNPAHFYKNLKKVPLRMSRKKRRL